ncbi:MAG: acetyltransferase [Thiotrichales bacterium]|nr:MAG: acetyltransferase [Thiotrichales bacterium]
MQYIDVFNGDADGLCALHQLRLNTPVESALVTGVKRDISLLERVDARAGDHITVFDISLDKNRNDLNRLLEGGCTVDYIDHHYRGARIDHPNLTAMIDTGASTCTSLLVNQRLGGEYPLWAAVGAFGDNLHERAQLISQQHALTEQQSEQLCRLGTYLNYNGYGSVLTDLFYRPDALSLMMRPYEDPFDFIASENVFNRLQDGYQDDMQKAAALIPFFVNNEVALYILPAEKWARRISGVFGNQLARGSTSRAHALLTPHASGTGYQASVRAPLNTKEGADVLCGAFPSGGGRKAAAGINHLPESDLDHFISEFKSLFSSKT